MATASGINEQPRRRRVDAPSWALTRQKWNAPMATRTPSNGVTIPITCQNSVLLSSSSPSTSSRVSLSHIYTHLSIPPSLILTHARAHTAIAVDRSCLCPYIRLPALGASTKRWSTTKERQATMTQGQLNGTAEPSFNCRTLGPLEDHRLVDARRTSSTTSSNTHRSLASQPKRSADNTLAAERSAAPSSSTRAHRGKAPFSMDTISAAPSSSSQLSRGKAPSSTFPILIISSSPDRAPL
ncbi:hypothetical protein BKA63DRAFT_169223 [Paraphoma chrysanthemicola]|nr:hypothetical protein BKA63DRAFT_169223 [Paraphoma chrysanthemicola]